MPTTKTRINITVSSDVERAIEKLARRDQVPQATKAGELLRMAIEFDEDIVLGAIASKRDTKNAKFVSEKTVWRKYGL